MFRICLSRVLRNVAAVASVDATPSSDKLTPAAARDILNRYVVGQEAAKKVMAVALRSRWRRKMIPDADLRADITPKNILMIGPTGVGKTEIARRMAKLTDAPFIKVEATKYTEVGFKGKDVDSIIEDLYTNAKTKARLRLEKEREGEAIQMALDVLLTATAAAAPDRIKEGMTVEEFKKEFDSGRLNDICVPINVSIKDPKHGDKPGRRADDGTIQILLSFSDMRFAKARKKQVTLPMQEAFTQAKKEALPKLVDESNITPMAKQLAEEDGIVFIDEIDKVCAPAGASDNDVSATGVQQDLLPIVEGSTVSMKDGTTIKTDNILFICSGAFHVVKPADMIAELQGRLPVKAELKPLTEQDFARILTEPKFNLIRQQIALMDVEGVKLHFPEDTIGAIAKAASLLNATAQNIGARRLHTIIEKTMDDISFDPEKYLEKQKVSAVTASSSENTVKSDGDSNTGGMTVITAADVEEAVKPLMKNIDLAKYLL